MYIYVSDPETVKLKLATLILEFGTAKPSGGILQTFSWVRSVDCDHRDRKD
jgi:hypothetical protein